MAEKFKMTSKHICRLLDEKFPDPFKHMIAFEVANGTGAASDRRADAISMEFWPSNGCDITGYEVKVSRSDWLSELNQPEKSLVISQFCDKWYLVAPKGVLRPDELPKGWGYIQVSEKSLRTKIKAPQRDNVAPDKLFMASLIRRLLNKYQDTDFLSEKFEHLEKEAKKNASVQFERDIRSTELELTRLRLALDEFEKISGIKINMHAT